MHGQSSKSFTSFELSILDGLKKAKSKPGKFLKKQDKNNNGLFPEAIDNFGNLKNLVGCAGVEPTTNGLKVRCSTN
jgi:hypothetical protein